jgi:hypothetical protein
MFCSLPRLILLTPLLVSPFHLQARSTSDEARDLYQRKVELWARNLNSALKVLLRTDIFLLVPKKVKFCFPVKYVYIHIFSHLTWLLQKNVGDGGKPLTYLNSALKVLSGLDIFPSGTKKVKFC